MRRHHKTHCIRGHLRGPGNYTSNGSCRECAILLRRTRYNTAEARETRRRLQAAGRARNRAPFEGGTAGRATANPAAQAEKRLKERARKLCGLDASAGLTQMGDELVEVGNFDNVNAAATRFLVSRGLHSEPEIFRRRRENQQREEGARP